jgi:tetratricopeptide (TPR) repeat protein
LLQEEVDLLVAAGNPDAARAELDRALADLAPESLRRPELLAARASARAAAGDNAGAIDDLEAAFALDGASYRAALVGALQKAVEAADAAGEKQVSHTWKLRLASVFGATGEADAARRILVNMVRQDPKDVLALRVLASLEMWSERWDTAVAVWKRLVALEEGDEAVTAALGLGDATARAGRPVDARGALEQVHAQLPANRAVREALAHVYDVAGEWAARAGITLEDARATEDADARYGLLLRAGTLFLVRAEDPAGAMAVMEEALTLRPNDPEGVALLADAYLTATRVSDAAALLETVMAPLKGRRARELAPLYWRVARVAREQGDHPNEVRALGQAIDCDSQNGEICSNVALRALELDERELATRALRAVTLLRTAGPMSKAVAYQHLGELAQKQGDPRRALTLLRRAVTEDPALEEARALMNRIERDA